MKLIPGILKRETGTVLNVDSPFKAMAVAEAFAGRRMRRGAPYRYQLFSMDGLEMLDEANREHVRAVLEHYAASHKMSVNDLGWCMGPALPGTTLRPVLVKPWEQVLRAQREG